MTDIAPGAKPSVFQRVTTPGPAAVPAALATAPRRRPDLPRQGSATTG